MSDIDALAASFQKDLDKAKRSQSVQQDHEFSRTVFRALAPVMGASVKEFMSLWLEDYDDPAYDIKYKYAELGHLHTTGTVINKMNQLLLPTKDMPHKLWGKFLKAVHLAATDYDKESAALVFRLRGNTKWVMTNENLTIPQLQPVIHITAPIRAPEVRILPWDLYVKTMEKYDG